MLVVNMIILLLPKIIIIIIKGLRFAFPWGSFSNLMLQTFALHAFYCADQFDHHPDLFIYGSHVPSCEYLQDLVSMESLLQSAGVWFCVKDEMSSVSIWRMAK